MQESNNLQDERNRVKQGIYLNITRETGGRGREEIGDYLIQNPIPYSIPSLSILLLPST